MKKLRAENTELWTTSYIQALFVVLNVLFQEESFVHENHGLNLEITYHVQISTHPGKLSTLKERSHVTKFSPSPKFRPIFCIRE